MAETPIQFGILGCAEIARKVSRAITLAPNATLYAVGSRSLEKARRFAAANGFPPSAKIYGSYEAVLDDPGVDAVYVPLPTSLHLKWAVLAAEKKKHVLLEKPVALNVAELDQILEACESNGVQFMDGTMWMHHPRTAKMKELLSDPQRFGQLKSNCKEMEKRI
ncbi:putative oxidoreductase [Vitis vinifera]|uniref:Putative oxidoreductase n=1 Tax=Vitis vinifera TaxID=29760 RepID=A0A438GGI8_VITVI|nr:putative oxidoreductase [Vitis vinifera]